MKLPVELGLPYTSWRTGQRSSIRTALHAKKTHTVIQAPTGAGKSLIAATLTKLDPQIRTMTLTATNALLTQYQDIYPHLTAVKGASNYECLAARDELKRYFRLVRHNHEIRCDDGPCRSGIKCSLKEDGCLYYDAVRRSAASPSPLTNYAYWLAMRRYAGGLGRVDRLILDEAHSVAEQLMQAFRIEIGRYELRGTGRWPKSMKEWRDWGAKKAERASESGDSNQDDHRVRRQKSIDRFRQLAQIDTDTWAYDVTNDAIVFEPVVPRLLFPLLADDATKIVYLSATITPAMLPVLGIDPADVEFFSLPSTFPVERRPVYIVRTARVDHKMSGETKDYWLARHDRIIGQRLDRKGVIHCSSYERQRLFVDSSAHRSIMMAPSSKELAETVERFRHAPAPAVLVSPSVETGFDFPYSDCEYQILSKVPFPDTRSAIMRGRIDATERYREHLTMQRVVQAVGRGMRAVDDRCETFILDDHIGWFLNKNVDLAPEWFLDALVWTRSLPRHVADKLPSRSSRRDIVRIAATTRRLTESLNPN